MTIKNEHENILQDFCLNLIISIINAVKGNFWNIRRYLSLGQ